MKTIENEVVITKHPLKKHGIMVSKSFYNAIVEFISNNVYFSEKINLPMLIKRSALQFPECRDISLFIYYIKLDLEARGMIEVVTYGNIRTLLIRLTKRGMECLIQKGNGYRK